MTRLQGRPLKQVPRKATNPPKKATAPRQEGHHPAQEGRHHSQEAKESPKDKPRGSQERPPPSSEGRPAQQAPQGSQQGRPQRQGRPPPRSPKECPPQLAPLAFVARARKWVILVAKIIGRPRPFLRMSLYRTSSNRMSWSMCWTPLLFEWCESDSKMEQKKNLS